VSGEKREQREDLPSTPHTERERGGEGGKGKGIPVRALILPGHRKPDTLRGLAPRPRAETREEGEEGKKGGKGKERKEACQKIP